MLHDFLLNNQSEILALTERKSVELAGARASSEDLRRGLPIFFRQLMEVLLLENNAPQPPETNKEGIRKAADNADEPGIAIAAGRPDEAALAEAAGLHGVELLRLGYTLSHVVHAYGAICQAITELATKKRIEITAKEFHDLNRCLDVAIAGAVTGYQHKRNSQDENREVEQLGFLAHELRNSLNSVNIALRLIKKGIVGFSGNTGRVLDQGLKRIEQLIDRSLTEVRLRVDPTLHRESGFLLQVIDQIAVTMEVEARFKNQRLEIDVDPTLVIETDQQLFYSVISNLVQNAIKFTPTGGRIQIRGNLIGEQVVVEVEDECGGLSAEKASDLFKPFTQQHQNRTGLGLGLTIAQRAIQLNCGSIEVHNLIGRGCIFKVTLPHNIH